MTGGAGARILVVDDNDAVRRKRPMEQRPNGCGVTGGWIWYAAAVMLATVRQALLAVD